MSRSISATITAATAKTATKPIYLLRLGFDAEVKAATWDQDITWNGETWIDSGIEVSSLKADKADIKFPNGTVDPWLSLVLNEGVLGRAVQIYEYHENTTSSPNKDAVLLFVGIMDDASISDNVISVNVIESSASKVFPNVVIDRPTFNYIPPAGTEIAWGPDKIIVK
jgi:hypothetical protein